METLALAAVFGSIYSTPALLRNGAEISGYQNAALTWLCMAGGASESGVEQTLFRSLVLLGVPVALAVVDFRLAGRNPRRGEVFALNAGVMTGLLAYAISLPEGRH